MSGQQPDLADLGKRMDSALEVLRKELQGLRTGRASASLLEPIMVEAYGSEMPLTQVGTVNVPEPRMLTVQVWDRGLVKAVEKAIRNSSTGPQSGGRRPAAAGAVAGADAGAAQRAGQGGPRYAEQARVAVRNVRRDGMDQLKRLGEGRRHFAGRAQALVGRDAGLTDRHIETVNQLLDQKEKDILQV